MYVGDSLVAEVNQGYCSYLYDYIGKTTTSSISTKTQSFLGLDKIEFVSKFVPFLRLQRGQHLHLWLIGNSLPDTFISHVETNS